MAMRNFRAVDMGRGDAKQPKPEPAKKATEPEKKPSDANTVPEGTAEEVLDWVGDDVTRARKALAAERKDDSPRKTVVEPLQKMIDDAKAAKSK